MSDDVMQKVYSGQESKIGIVLQPSKNGTIIRRTNTITYQDQELRYTDRFDDNEYYMSLPGGPAPNTSAFSNAFDSGAYG